MSENLGLGRIITTDQQRDAIHIAVVPMVAGKDLARAELVSIGIDGCAYPVQRFDATCVGIADPFLERGSITKGQRFWLYLNPGSITSLRHVWTHPAFDGEPKPDPDAIKEASEQWLRNLADRIDKGYGEMMLYAAGFAVSKSIGEWPAYLTGGCEMEGEVTPEEFWDHYAIVTGDVVAPEHRGNFFSCSCG